MSARPLSTAEIAAQRRAEEEKNYRDLYGGAMDAVRILQRRGFIVTKEGTKIRVDRDLLTEGEVIAKAGREAELAGMAAPVRRVVETASGLRVGQKVAVTPKAKPKPPAAPPVPRPPRAAPAPKPAAPTHSTDLGAKPRAVWLDLGLLTVDRRYQREINKDGRTHINRITKAFNWNCYQPIVVTEGDDGTSAFATYIGKLGTRVYVPVWIIEPTKAPEGAAVS